MSNWVKRNSLNTVEEIVLKNTGMTDELLLNDNRKYVYPGIVKAAALFLNHVKRGSKIQFWCDYDTDGISSAYIVNYTLARPLKIRNIRVECPGRYTDGYGVKPSIVERMVGTNLLVLCDNGIAANEAVDLAKAMGMDIIILDHHDPRIIDGKVVLPNADVIVDPHVTGGFIYENENQVTEFKDLCGAGVTWYFCHEVRNLCTWMSDKQKWYLDQIAYIGAAIGTIGDVVNLVDDNRRIVKIGLSNLNKGMGTVGIKEMINQLYLNDHISSTDIGFLISPVINAYGRLEDVGPNKILSILCNDTKSEDGLGGGATPALRDEVRVAIEMNKKRKVMTKEAVNRVIETYDANGGDDPFIICYDEGSITGIVGLVAGELVSKYHKPALVFAPTGKDDGVIKGSGRSVEGIDIKNLLDQVQKYLTTYGGHPMACGASLLLENLDDLGDALNAITPVLETSDDILFDIDGDINQVDDLISRQDKYEPYGAGNPLPVYRFKNVYLGQANTMGSGNEHLKFQVDKNEIVWFYGREAYEEMGSPERADILVTLSWHFFKGEANIQMQVIDMMPSAQ